MPPQRLRPLPPQPRQSSFKRTHHGVVLKDPYHWLKERRNPDVLDHLAAENAYTASVMAESGDLADRIYKELLGRIEEENESAPYRKGRYLYKSRIQKGENYRTYLRKPVTGGEWSAYFNSNSEAEGLAFFEIGFLDVNPNGDILAYAVDTSGEEAYTLQFRNLDSGEDLPIQIKAVSADGEWSADGDAYYFIRETESRKPYQVFRYMLGTTEPESELVYEELDEQFFAGIYKSQDREYLFAYSESNETTEISFLKAKESSTQFELFTPRQQNIQYWLEHHQGNWLVRSNEKAPDFKLLSLPIGSDYPGDAVELEPARANVRLTDVLPLKSHRILFETRDGLDHIRIQDLSTRLEHELEVPDAVFDLQAGINEEYDTDRIQVIYSSPIRPTLTIDYDLNTRERTILKRKKVPSGHDPEAFTTRRVSATSFDGTLVPLTIIHPKCLKHDGSSPAFLYAYGAYGSPETAAFNPLWLTWLQRGFSVAIAHVRGGGLLGEDWYQAGKLQNKQNSFHDFISCADYLIQEGYTMEEKLVIEGGSAGGTLIGAVLNQRPDLFKAAVAAVPFVDVVNTMLDDFLPLTTFEYEEWGNPNDKVAFQNMIKWSPYDNVSSQPYPAILATAGLNDPRVPYWEAAKWVARLRAANTSQSPILLRTDLSSGHTGPSGRYPLLKETAVEQAFLLWQLGY